MTGRRDLGHFDSLLGNMRIELPAHLHQLILHLRHRNIKRRHDERVVGDLFHGAPLVPLLRPDLKTVGQAEPLRCPRCTTRRTPNPPWIWPSSGFVKRRTSRALHLGTKNGAGLRPTPCARSSARVATTSGAGAPSSASLRSCQSREQRKPSSPAGVFTRKDTHKREGNFGSNACCCCGCCCYCFRRKLTGWNVYVHKRTTTMQVTETNYTRASECAMTPTPTHISHEDAMERVSRVPSASTSPRNSELKHRLGTLLHSNRMEKERIRIRVHVNVEIV